MINKDTICAISTPPGVGGVATIRISGTDAIDICDKIFKTAKGNNKISQMQGNKLTYGNIYNQIGEVIDDVVISLFRNPNSYTGEDTVEISCHGSLYIQQNILQLLIEAGCRAALPGEFTQRAFLNGKMDLSQAEAVADLIASSSSGQHRLAINQMRGGFAKQLSALRLRLLNFVALMELELDFSEEEVEFADRKELLNLATEIEESIKRLTDSFSLGNAVKNGIPVAIVGETNAGKSTLLNNIVGEEKAIVSDIHGTTRDVIEDTVSIGGILFRFIDTAGIRETNDVIENLGIERTFNKIEAASIVLWLVDLSSDIESIENMAALIEKKTANKKLILVCNKTDLLANTTEELDKTLLPNLRADRVYISAKHNRNTNILLAKLQEASSMPELSQNDVIVTNIRHYEALTKAKEAINRANQGITANLSGDFISQDIRECMHYLSEITGEISNTDILETIFGQFCIGK